MRRENGKRKGLNRLLVLVLAAAITMAFSFTSISFAAEESGRGSTGLSTSGTETAENTELSMMHVGQSDAYIGNVPENKSFAYIESRYYDGTAYVKIFNIGWYLGKSGQYYTNGDWTDMNNIAHRENYTADEACTEYTNNAIPGQVPRPENYPANDVGGDADGQLSSYNAGVYKTVAWDNFSLYGRGADKNYNWLNVVKGSGLATYVEIWKVDPQLSLSIDKTTLKKGDTFTAVLTINNNYNNNEGLPTAEQIEFTSDSVDQTTKTIKDGNVYTADSKYWKTPQIH